MSFTSEANLSLSENQNTRLSPRFSMRRKHANLMQENKHLPEQSSIVEDITAKFLNHFFSKPDFYWNVLFAQSQSLTLCMNFDGFK